MKWIILNNSEFFSQNSEFSANFWFVFANLIEKAIHVTIFWNLARNPEKNSSKIRRKNAKFDFFAIELMKFIHVNGPGTRCSLFSRIFSTFPETTLLAGSAGEPPTVGRVPLRGAISFKKRKIWASQSSSLYILQCTTRLNTVNARLFPWGAWISKTNSLEMFLHAVIKPCKRMTLVLIAQALARRWGENSFQRNQPECLCMLDSSATLPWSVKSIWFGILLCWCFHADDCGRSHLSER